MPKIGSFLVLWAVMAAGASVAQPTQPVPATATAPGIVTTHAEARRRLPNTVSDVVVTIEVHGRDVPGAAKLLADRSNRLLAYLRAQAAERLQSEQTSFEPELQEVRGQPDRIKGFTGRAAVSFRTTPDRVPVLLAGSLDNGATGLQQSGSAPTIEEQSAARRELASEATRVALEQAQAIAAAVQQRVAGIHLVEVDPFRLAGSGAAEADRRVMRAARPTAPIGSEAGEAEIAVLVVLTVRLAPPS